jgi:dTDP-4-amino-4,6-dideoxygalactose transaminase
MPVTCSASLRRWTLAPLAGRRIAIVDAAQAQGASRLAAPRAASESSPPPALPARISAPGDAGAVLTASDEIAHRLRALGTTAAGQVSASRNRLQLASTLQAVVLSAKLRASPVERRAAGGAAMRRAARGHPDPPGHAARQSAHLAPLRGACRGGRLLSRLAAAGIGAGIHTRCRSTCKAPSASGQRATRSRAPRRDPVLPLFAEITPAQQERTVAVLKQALS